MSERNELIVIEEQNAREIFTTPGGLQAIVSKIDRAALTIAPDLSTATGRKAIASNAYRVAQTKTYIDNIGKSIVDELKELPKIVDANRKQAREALDALRDLVRKPLSEWEEEQERIAAAKKAEEESAALALEIERCHELALLMNKDFDAQIKARQEAEENARKEREKLIAQHAAEAARAEAEAKAMAEKNAVEEASRIAAEEANRKLQSAKMEAERLELEKKQAEERHCKELENARLQAIAEEQAKQKKAAEELQRLEFERQQASEKLEHRRKINKIIVAKLAEHAKLSEEQAIDVVKACASGLIDFLAIKY